jgi:glycosyltransferase involved in cell wall biosynthesis
VQKLAQRPGILVTGGVPDLRPYLGHAALVVAPLRVARGIQNKVLEALAMGAPTLVSPGARCGLEAEAGRDLMVADSPTEWIDTVQALLRDTDRRHALGAAGRSLVLARHSWPHQLAELDRLIDGVVAARTLADLPARMAEAERRGAWLGGLAEGGVP